MGGRDNCQVDWPWARHRGSLRYRGSYVVSPGGRRWSPGSGGSGRMGLACLVRAGRGLAEFEAARVSGGALIMAAGS